MENKQSKIGLYDDCFNETVFESVKKNSTCLDVGCWTGNLGKALIEKKNCTVDGIDINKLALEKARGRGYRNTFLVDLNNEHIAIDLQKKYDFIICADILEHLINPEKVLIQSRDYLKEDGQIIISVPNIAFVQQRFFLLFGKFDYSLKGGIMDENHLRFFTLKSICKLCLKSGYKIVESHGYSQVKRKYFFLKILSKIFPGMFAIQLLLKAKKNEQAKY
jgi:O-antigen biosynthesis protein